MHSKRQFRDKLPTPFTQIDLNFLNNVELTNFTLDPLLPP